MPKEKISQEELNKLKSKKGVRVRTKMGAQPGKPAIEPEKQVEPEPSAAPEVQPHAAMAASMAAHEAEMRRIDETINAKIAEFSQELREVSARGTPITEGTFIMRRDDKDLLERVFFKAGIHE